MKTEKNLKIGSTICTGVGITIIAVGMVVHPVLPLGIAMTIKANVITAGILSVAGTILENSEGIGENIQYVAETIHDTVDDAVHNVSENIHDANEVISNFFNQPVQHTALDQPNVELHGNANYDNLDEIL